MLLALCLHLDPPATTPVLAPGAGGVAYVYRAGVHEVTNAQYADFLNHTATTSDEHGLWTPAMRIAREGDPSEGGPARYNAEPAYADRPVQFIRWSDAVRFANWLHHGRPEGDSEATEDGAYLLRDQPTPWRTVERSADARWFVLSEAEFVKAARFDPASGVIWNFATGSNSAPTPALVDAAGAVVNPGPGTVNHAAAANWDGSTRGNVTIVGDCGAPSPWGAFDMNGNVLEWLDGLSVRRLTDPDGTTTVVDWEREFAGGAYSTSSQGLRVFGVLGEAGADVRAAAVGFRVGSLCPPDVNHDGFLDYADYAEYVGAFEAGDPAADVDFNGFVDFFDYAKFVDLFERC